MSKNNISNFLSINDYKDNQKEDYLNIAKQNEENFDKKQFEKFKPKNSTKSVTNLLKVEEEKLKNMLFSILKNEESQIIDGGKSPNNRKRNKLSIPNIISSINDENLIKKPFNKNFK